MVEVSFGAGNSEAHSEASIVKGMPHGQHWAISPRPTSPPASSEAPVASAGTGKELNYLTADAMRLSVATDAKCNQVVHHIATKLAPAFYVMDLQTFQRTALLTPPTVAFQDPVSDNSVFFWAQFEPGLLLT
jgi:hypothetical protein